MINGLLKSSRLSWHLSRPPVDIGANDWTGHSMNPSTKSSKERSRQRLKDRVVKDIKEHGIEDEVSLAKR